MGYINQVVSSGPLQFAASQHYVEFLYPIFASAPVYFGVPANVVEMVLPAVMACMMVVATGFLALESGRWEIAVLSTAFASGWYAVYAMGTNFHASLFAFPFLALATILLVRTMKTGQSTAKGGAVFVGSVVIAAAAHVETTDFFVAAWAVGFVLVGWTYMSTVGRKGSLMVIAAAVATLPFSLAYFLGVGGGLGTQYCVFPPYWLEVFGPSVALAIAGLGLLAWRFKSNEGYFEKLLLSLSILALGVGTLGYVSGFSVVISDRSLLLLPIPLVSSLGALRVSKLFPTIHKLSKPQILAIFAVAIPILIAPPVFSYALPHFRYFAEHGTSVIACASN